MLRSLLQWPSQAAARAAALAVHVAAAVKLLRVPAQQLLA
jgi:hypothetical protein